jgi:RimJ/RimL family protein N-acetyltransferase
METYFEHSRSRITLRPAQEADVEAYRALRLEALKNHPTAFSADHAFYARQPLSVFADRLRGLGSDNMIYFAETDAGLVGMCGIYRGNSPKTAHSAAIWGVYVKSEWRNLQVAEALIGRCVEWARAQGITIIKIAATSTNTAAIRCYARCGFTVYGIEPHAMEYEGVMYDEVLMAREI